MNRFNFNPFDRRRPERAARRAGPALKLNFIRRARCKQRLAVDWLEHSSASNFRLPPAQRAFTLLELMVVLGIIGLLVGLALPHVRGFTSGSAMTGATRQLLDDVALARQRAIANRSEICMVFAPPNFWVNSLNTTLPHNNVVTNLVNHQYAAYALISMRTVGDQPGRSNVHYITDWTSLPQGIFISPYQFTNNPGLIYSNNITTTNTLSSVINNFSVAPFLTNIAFPFPTTYDYTNLYNLPYIAFMPSGQLATNNDQFIMLANGSIFYPQSPNGTPAYQPANMVETPPNNEFSTPNLVHIDWLTGRAKLERNQF